MTCRGDSAEVKTAAQRASVALGWLSVGLGAASLLAPERTARLVGMRATRGTRRGIRAVGLQELAAAGAVFATGRPAPALWSRVAGDAVHLTLLGRGLRTGQARTRRTAAAVAAVAAVTAVDAATARALSQTSTGTLRVRGTITVNRPPADVYAQWRDLERLPSFMSHVDSVDVGQDGRSRWMAKAPGGVTVEWDAELTADVPGERLSWRSVEPSSVDHAGTVVFTDGPGETGTEVTVDLEYRPAPGVAGAMAAKLFGEEPSQQVRDDLRRFKQMVETGEVVRSDASGRGSRSQNQWHQAAAQPQGDAS